MARRGRKLLKLQTYSTLVLMLGQISTRKIVRARHLFMLLVRLVTSLLQIFLLLLEQI